jgi:glutathione S-transferase
MYKAQGTPFGVFGTNRKAGLNELLTQLRNIGRLVDQFHGRFPRLIKGRFIAGTDEITLADASLFPTYIFCQYMLPLYAEHIDFRGLPRLTAWFEFMSSEVEAAREVRQEIETALDQWKARGRFDPIIIELKEAN